VCPRARGSSGIAIFGGIILLMLAKERMTPASKPLSQHEFFLKVDSNLIARATVNYVAQSAYLREIEGTYYELNPRWEQSHRKRAAKEVAFRTKARLTEKMEDKLFALDKFEAREPNTFLLSLGYHCDLSRHWLDSLVLLYPSDQDGPARARSALARARPGYSPRNATRLTFKDVAGIGRGH